MDFPFSGAHLGTVDVETADRVALEGTPGFVAFTLWQTADAVTLQAAVHRRAVQRDTRLEGEQAIIQRQQAVAANRDDRARFFDGKPVERSCFGLIGASATGIPPRATWQRF